MARQLPAGMRNNNPGNIKYVGQKGTHPSLNTDQGDPQAVYPSAEAGMAAMYQLLAKKYRGGKLTPDQIIAGQGGWTPNNHQAAANVAASMGIGPHDDIGLLDPGRAAKFMRALMLQEHGQASMQYPDSMIASAIAPGGATTPMQAAANPIQINQAAPPVPAVTDGPKGQESYTPAHQAAVGQSPGAATTSMSGVTPAYGLPPAMTGETAIADAGQPKFEIKAQRKKNWMEELGAGIGDIKMAPSQISPLQQPAGPARQDADAGIAPVAQANPNRMALAQMMLQRLNSGRLF